MAGGTGRTHLAAIEETYANISPAWTSLLSLRDPGPTHGTCNVLRRTSNTTNAGRQTVSERRPEAPWHASPTRLPGSRPIRMRKCKLGIDSIETTLTWERGDRCLPNPWRDDRSILRLEDGISIFISVELRFSRNDAADKGNDDQVSRWVNIKKGRGQPVAPRRAPVSYTHLTLPTKA